MASEQKDQKVDDKNVKRVKRSRKVMSLSDKMRVLEMLERGQTKSSVGRFFGVNESTIRTIKKSEKAIRGSASRGTPESLKKSFISRDANIEKMEKDLHLWLLKQRSLNKHLSVYVIRKHASQKYKLTIQSGPKVVTFIASNGWLDRFKKRYSLYKEKQKAEKPDHEAAAKYPEQLKKVIEENGYLPQQVFNADETILFWKQMPPCTSIAKEEKSTRGFKPGKDKLKVLLCSNASGDFIMKPMLLHRLRNPCPLKRKCQKHFSVYMRGNHRMWITETLFIDWFQNCFVPEVKQYLCKRNLEFKVLLILDTAPADKSSILDADPHVQVISIPPNTTTLLQPMHLGVLEMFKVYYTRRMFDYLADLMKRISGLTVKVAWQNFSICNALTIMEKSVREIKQSTLNGAWRKLWKEVVTGSESFPPVVKNMEKVVTSARRLGGEGFENVELSDIADLLDSYPQKIVEKYFRKVITSRVDKADQCGLTSSTSDIVKQSQCKSEHPDDSEKRDSSVESPSTYRGEGTEPSDDAIEICPTKRSDRDDTQSAKASDHDICHYCVKPFVIGAEDLTFLQQHH